MRYRQDQLLQRQLSGKSFRLIVPTVQLRLTALQVRRANKPCDLHVVLTGQIPVGTAVPPVQGLPQAVGVSGDWNKRDENNAVMFLLLLCTKQPIYSHQGQVVYG